MPAASPPPPPPPPSMGTGGIDATTPPGWYPDPDGDGLRWWDGAGWTEHEAAAAGMACLMCTGKEFDRAQYMLNTQGLSLLGWDAFNRQATCFVCRRCGFIHWFAPAPPARR